MPWCWSWIPARLRHRQPSDHAPVHAVAGAESAAGRDRARLRLRLRHPAIVAKKLGAGNTLGIDIDPNAVEASRYNAERNRVEATFALPETVSEATHDRWWPISFPTRSLMAAMLSARVRPGGRPVLSGVLERQADEVAAAYARWIALSVWRSEGRLGLSARYPHLTSRRWPPSSSSRAAPHAARPSGWWRTSCGCGRDWCAAAAAIRSSMPAST